MEEKKSKPLFVFPWGFVESFLFSFSLVLLGFVIEYFNNGAYYGLPSMPYNVILFGVLIIIYCILHFFFNDPLIRWLSSIPATIASVTAYTSLMLILGFIPQEVKDVNSVVHKLGMTHVTESLPFLFSSFMLLTVLSFTILRRLTPFNLRNLGFFLNHFGLLLIIIAASFGSSDSQQLSLKMYEGDKFGVAFDKFNQHHKLPFKVELIDFSMKTYNPELVVINKESNFVKDKDGKVLFTIDKNKKYSIGRYEIKIEKYLESCKPVVDSFAPLDMMGATSAAFIRVNKKESKDKEVAAGWISCGSIIFQEKALMIESDFTVSMNKPQPKKYMSKVKIYFPDGKVKIETIEVNKPLKVNGWYIYQMGYDETIGKWSAFSIFEFVYDPWLKVIFVGVALLMAGACFLIWYDKLI